MRPSNFSFREVIVLWTSQNISSHPEPGHYCTGRIMRVSCQRGCGRKWRLAGLQCGAVERTVTVYTVGIQPSRGEHPGQQVICEEGEM